MIQTSDKTKRLIIVPTEMYGWCSKDHIKDEHLTDWNEVKKIEKTLNVYCKWFQRIFNLGQNYNNKDRWETTLKVVDCQPPTNRYHVKDHEDSVPDQTHPKTIDITSTVDGPLSRIEYITSMWMDPMLDNLNIHSMNICIQIPENSNRRRLIAQLRPSSSLAEPE